MLLNRAEKPVNPNFETFLSRVTYVNQCTEATAIKYQKGVLIQCIVSHKFGIEESHAVLRYITSIFELWSYLEPNNILVRSPSRIDIQ